MERYNISLAPKQIILVKALASYIGQNESAFNQFKSKENIDINRAELLTLCVDITDSLLKCTLKDEQKTKDIKK